jgi:hypothetical protein
MKIQALILAPAPNIKMVLFCLHFFTSQLLLSQALSRLATVWINRSNGEKLISAAKSTVIKRRTQE